MRAARAIVTALAAVALPAAACTTFCVRGADGSFFGRNCDYSMLVAFAKSPHDSTPAALVKNEAARVDARRCVSA